MPASAPPLKPPAADERFEAMQARLSAVLAGMEAEFSRGKRNMPEPEAMPDPVMERIAQWASNRARFRAAKAELDRITHYQTALPDGEEDTIQALQAEADDALDGMAWMEKELAKDKPATARAAALMIGMALDILAAREDDAESRLAHGPAMQILRNARAALAATRRDLSLDPAAAA
jgi:hypothetical protein